jgi:RNA binding exosome subunit
MRDTNKNKENVLIALKKHLGVVKYACEEAGISRKTFYVYCQDPEFKKQVEMVDEMTIDFVEHKLLKKINEESEKSIHFYLRFKGKNRGYSDSVDITSGGDKILTDININIVLPKKDEDNE